MNYKLKQTSRSPAGLVKNNKTDLAVESLTCFALSVTIYMKTFKAHKGVRPTSFVTKTWNSF